MAAEQNQNQNISYDVDGFDKISAAMVALLNQFPGLTQGDKITFADLDDAKGKAIVPTQGSVIQSEKKYISGLVLQTCVFPFALYYRGSNLSEARRQMMSEWLDQIGRWLELQPVTISGTVAKLTSYPDLSDGRKILSIRRTQPAGCTAVYQNGAEDWTINLQLTYRHEFNTTT